MNEQHYMRKKNRLTRFYKDENGKPRQKTQQFKSINAAKRESRRLQQTEGGGLGCGLVSDVSK